MRYLSGDEEEKAFEYISKAVQIALDSTCERARCGSVIVKDGEIIGVGFNSPPQNLESQRRCSYSKGKYHKKISDKTCCVHAEQRAIMDALTKNPDKIKGARLYFIRIDNAGKISHAGNPYCTHCSKLALDIGISEFVLWHENGVCVYNAEEYNTISYQYKEARE